jgi:hypothetical protein
MQQAPTATWQLHPKEQLDTLADQEGAQWLPTEGPRNDPVVWVMFGAVTEEGAGRYDSPGRRQYELDLLQAVLEQPQVAQLSHSVQHYGKGGRHAHLEICLKRESQARQRAEQLISSGLQVKGHHIPVRYARGRQPAGTVRVMVMGLPGPYAVRGLMEALLTCAGYMDGAGMLVAEFLGELMIKGVPYPAVGRGDMVVAYVKPPGDDPLLLNLPESMMLQGCTVRLAVEGRQGPSSSNHRGSYTPVSGALGAGRAAWGSAGHMPPPPPPPRATSAASGAAMAIGAGGDAGVSQGLSSASIHLQVPLPQHTTRMEGIESSQPSLVAPTAGLLSGPPPGGFPPPPPAAGAAARTGVAAAAAVATAGQGGSMALRPGLAPGRSQQHGAAWAGGGASAWGSGVGMAVAGAGRGPHSSSWRAGGVGEAAGLVAAAGQPLSAATACAGRTPRPQQPPPSEFDTWVMTSRFASAMGEAIGEFADGPETQKALRVFFGVFSPRLLRKDADNPATAADLPGFATVWLQQHFQVPEYPSSEAGSERSAGPSDTRPKARRRGKGSGGSGGSQRQQGTGTGDGRQRSHSAGASPKPPARRGSTCPDPPAGLRRSDRQRKPPDPQNMYSSSSAGAGA